jgi:hypothetical protein
LRSFDKSSFARNGPQARHGAQAAASLALSSLEPSNS